LAKARVRFIAIKHSSPENSVLMPSRRSFLSILTDLIGVAIGAILGVPALGYIFAPLRRRGSGQAEEGFFDAGSWSELAEGTPQLVTIEMMHQDGWIQSKVRHSIWVLKKGADLAVVLTPICPHLGCPVNWDAARGEYACPCHASFFDTVGKVLSGPSPRALDPLPYQIRGGRLLIHWIDFRQGTASREPVTV
jgi:Rieske Fe-S protein